MRLQNILIAVNDIDKSIEFYKEIFDLYVILRQEGNVVMSEGLVLQDLKLWEEALDKVIVPRNNMSEIYFEEANMEGFINKLNESKFDIEYVTEVMTLDWGQKIVRLYDPDGNLIEVRTPSQI